jgi:hypothetical protein
MAVDLEAGRQELIAARVTVTYDDFDDAGNSAENAIALPYNAIVIGGHVTIKSAFDATITLDVGDEASDTAYASGVAADATGLTSLTPDGTIYTSPDHITVNVSGAVTQGEAEIVVTYIVKGRAAFSYD